MMSTVRPTVRDLLDGQLAFASWAVGFAVGAIFGGVVGAVAMLIALV